MSGGALIVWSSPQHRARARLDHRLDGRAWACVMSSEGDVREFAWGDVTGGRARAPAHPMDPSVHVERVPTDPALLCITIDWFDTDQRGRRVPQQVFLWHPASRALD